MADDDSLMMRGRIFGAPLKVLTEIVEEQEIDVGSLKTLTRPEAVRLVDGWFVDELKSPDRAKAAMVALAINFDTTLTEPVKDTKAPIKKEIDKAVTGSGTLFKKDLKISGQVDSKSGITFMSLRRQIETAISKGYSETDIIDAIIKAIPPTSVLRRYLEGKEDLNLQTAKNILRAHYNEKSAAELYNELGQATQGQKETPTEFLMRSMDLKQKILFASKEQSEELKYSQELVSNLFVRTVYTGLQSATIRQEFKDTLEDTKTEDDELIDKLNKIVSRENERLSKFNKTKVHELSEAKQNDDIKTLKADIAELKELFSQQMMVSSVERKPPQQSPVNACGPCEAKGLTKCEHCWRCGSSEHFKRGCRVSGNGKKSHRGGRM